MRILYTNFHSGPGIGGHTVYVQRLAQALAARHEVAIATPASSAPILASLICIIPLNHDEMRARTS